MEKFQRVKLVLDIENKFFNNMFEAIMCSIQNNELFIGLIKNVCELDVSNVGDSKKLFNILKKCSSDIEKELNLYSNTLQLLNNADEKDKHRVMQLINEGFDIDINYAGKISPLEVIMTNNEIGLIYLELYNFVIKIENYKNIINSIDNPVKLFNKIIDINNALKNQMEKMSIGGTMKLMMDYSLGDNFDELLSVKALKAEICAEEQTKIQNISKKEKNKAYEKVNNTYTQIEGEIDNLKKISIGEQELLQIMIKKESFDNQFKMPLVQADDDLIISLASEKLDEIKNDLLLLKSKIIEVLKYAGEDVRDILRDEQPYIIRDYVEKLNGMSKKYNKLVSESDAGDTKDLLRIYKKANDLYSVVEEMRNNAYVVDSARFIK